MKLYQEKFEVRFLEETSTFYGHQARKFLETGDVGNYMTQVLQVLKDEECRAFEFLDKYVDFFYWKFYAIFLGLLSQNRQRNWQNPLFMITWNFYLRRQRRWFITKMLTICTNFISC